MGKKSLSDKVKCYIFIYNRPNSYSCKYIFQKYFNRFSCEGLTIKVRTNDHLHLICPKKELNTRQLDQTPNEADLFEKIYLLNDNQYENYRTCNSSGKWLNFLLFF